MSEILVGGSGPYVHGSKRFGCSSCGGEIWLAPSGQEIKEARPVTLMCADCTLQLFREKDN